VRGSMGSKGSHCTFEQGDGRLSASPLAMSHARHSRERHVGDHVHNKAQRSRNAGMTLHV
jgi:hypothetical protein